MIANFYTLKYLTYCRIVTGKQTIKIGKQRFETVKLSLLGKGSDLKLLQAWGEIGREIMAFTKESDPETEMMEQYKRMDERRLSILICMTVLQDRESKDAVDALRRLGVTCTDDRFEAFTAAKTIYTGIKGNMDDLEQELKHEDRKMPTYRDYQREYNIVNKQMGGSMRFDSVLLTEYLDARDYIKQENDRNQSN